MLGWFTPIYGGFGGLLLLYSYFLWFLEGFTSRSSLSSFLFKGKGWGLEMAWGLEMDGVGVVGKVFLKGFWGVHWVLGRIGG